MNNELVSIDFNNHFDHYEILVQDEVALEKIKKDQENKLEVEKEKEQQENIKPKINIPKKPEKKSPLTVSKAPSEKQDKRVKN